MRKKDGINNFSILIADGHEIIHRALKDLIKTFWPGVKVISATTIKKALLKREQAPSLIIMDIDLSGTSNVKSIQQFKNCYPAAKIMVFSSLNEEIYAVPILKSGVSGFVSKAASESEIITAITAILAGSRYVRQSVRECLLNKMFDHDIDNPFITLSSRELEVAGLLRLGLGVSEISKQLNLQMGTVSTYKIRIFQKLKISNVIALAEKMGANEVVSGA